MRRFLAYYQWHLIFALLVIVCAVFVYTSVTRTVDSDLRVAYSCREYMNAQTFRDMKAEFELLIRDANGDGDKNADVTVFSDDDENKVIEKLKEYVVSDEYDIYISTADAFEAVEDKKCFADTEKYYIYSDDDDVLKDESGRVYAVSLNNNTIAKTFGIPDNANLYIAAAVDEGEATTYRKNGSNITGYIIENKYKYKFN